MKKHIFSVLLALFCYTFISAQDTLPTEIQLNPSGNLNRVVYKVSINDGVKKKRYLWGITDSTITLGTSRDNPNKGLRTIPAEQINWIKVRKEGKIGIGIGAGMAIGGLIGYIYGYTTADKSDTFFSPDFYGKIAALPVIPIGGILGGILAGRRPRMNIDGRRTVLAAEKQNLKQYLRWK